jgi:hypothetical protein
MHPIAALLPAALLLAGCAGGGFQVGVETRSTRLQPMPPPLELLTRSPTLCMVLPATGLSNLSTTTSAAFSAALTRRVPDATVVLAGQTASVINTAGLFRTLEAMLAGHATAGLLDPAALSRIGDTLGVEFVLLPSVALVDRNEQSRFSFFGATLLFSSWTRAQATLQLWRTDDGALVWQSVGGGSIDSETPAGTPTSLLDTLEQIFDAMIEDLLLGRDRSLTTVNLPPPKPTPAPATPPPSRPAEGASVEAAPVEAEPGPTVEASSEAFTTDDGPRPSDAARSLPR